MNRLLRLLFLCLAALLAVYAVLWAYQLNAAGFPVLSAKSVWLPVAGAVFFGVAAGRFSLRMKFRIFLVILGLALAEGFLQGLSWLGVLPGVNIRFNAPYARAYWTSEGHDNGMRNRFGWHYPEFNPKAPRRVAVIGDSFVEACEVGRSQNEAAVLQQLLRAQSPEWAVFGLGIRGASPADYLELLDYAARHLAPQEAIVLVYLGNDVNESSPSLNYAPPANYIYYDLDSGHHLVLNPASAGARDGLRRLLEMPRRSVLANLPMTINSHCMILQSVFSIRDGLGLASTTRQLIARDPEAARWGGIGLSLKPFAAAPDPEARQALEVMLAELALMQQRCETNHIQLRLVTIPFFPPQFYATQHGRNWTLQLDAYDFLRLDREVAAFARERGIPFCSFADWLTERKTDVNDIHGLYFSNGSGHFTERGHRLCAEAMNDAFYTKPQP
jgi:hypothetical protein